MVRYKSLTWTDSELSEVIRNSTSLSSAIRKLGLHISGSSFSTIKKHTERLGLSTSHFQKSNIQEHLKRLGTERTPDSKIFMKNSKVSSACLRQTIKREKLIKYECVECGNKGFHNDKKLVLQIDHINGVNNDNRKSNIRYLCPNCHSQTLNYARTKSTRYDLVLCKFCKENFRPLSGNKNKLYCSMKCSGHGSKGRIYENQRKINYDLVMKEYNIHKKYLTTAKKFGISDRAVAKIVKKCSDLPLSYPRMVAMESSALSQSDI
jgi:predicted RNA-binding Zn-ribbon protein involved in translation (DUF1610 family)